MTKTAQILVEGRYSGVLEPERHYLPVRRDFSNLDEVLERARDRDATRAAGRRRLTRTSTSAAATARGRLTETMEQVLDEHGRRARSRACGPVLHAIAERRRHRAEETERVAVAPVANVAPRRAGRRRARWLAGLRLVGGRPRCAAAPGRLPALDRDPRARQPARRRSPTCSRRSYLRRACAAPARCAAQFRSASRREIDERAAAASSSGATPRAAPQGDVRERRASSTNCCATAAVDFLWDHSAVGAQRRVPARRLADAPSAALPAGPHPLPALNWLAPRRPGARRGGARADPRLRDVRNLFGAAGGADAPPVSFVRAMCGIGGSRQPLARARCRRPARIGRDDELAARAPRARRRRHLDAPGRAWRPSRTAGSRSSTSSPASSR